METEIRRNSVREPALQAVFLQPWLPPAVDLASISLGLAAAARRIRAALASPGDHPLEHLGEAESIAYVKHLGNARFFVEDSSAYRRGQHDGIVAKRTTDLLSEMVAMDDCSRDEAFAIYTDLVSLGRLPQGLTIGELLA